MSAIDPKLENILPLVNHKLCLCSQQCGCATAESLMFMTGPHGGALPMTYSPFPTGDGSWTPTFDPFIVPAGFGFAGPNMMNPQH